MTALALRWEGKERAVSVSKVENVDPQRHVYRAQARFDGIDYVVDVWLATDGDQLRLKLFDNDQHLAGLSLVCRGPRPRRRSTGRGTAASREPRTTSARAWTPTRTPTRRVVVAIGTGGRGERSRTPSSRHVYFTGARRAACEAAPSWTSGSNRASAGTLPRTRASSASGRRTPRPVGADMGAGAGRSSRTPRIRRRCSSASATGSRCTGPTVSRSPRPRQEFMQVTEDSPRSGPPRSRNRATRCSSLQSLRPTRRSSASTTVTAPPRSLGRARRPSRARRPPRPTARRAGRRRPPAEGTAQDFGTLVDGGLVGPEDAHSRRPRRSAKPAKSCARRRGAPPD